MRVEIVIFDGFDELDAIAPFEVLRKAALGGADVEARLVTPTGDEEIVAAHGLRVRPDGRLGEEPDLLIVPGGGWVDHAPQGVRAEIERGGLPEAIARLHGAGTVVASVCTGAMLLAAAGLTGGRPATTNRAAMQEFRETGAEVVEARVVDDGDLVTAGGVTSGLDLGLWLIERYFGAPGALAMENGLEHERRGVVWRRQKVGEGGGTR